MLLASGTRGDSASHALVTSEGRWPRICELREHPRDLRVAMLSLHTSPLAALGRSRDAGGMNVYVRELSRHLGRHGINVDIFTRWTDPSTPRIISLGTRARVIQIPAGPIAPLHKNDLFPYVPQFADGIECFAVSERLDYHVIHSHYWLSGVAGQILAQRWGAAHIVMFHTLAKLKQYARAEENEPPLRIEYERRLLADADSVIVATPDERTQIARLYGVNRMDFHVVPCGVDLRHFTPADRQEARSRLARELDLGDEPVILSVRRLDPLKAPDVLVRALALMSQPATLLLVGGNAGDPERARLAALADELGISRRVRLIDAVPQHILPDYYRAADVFAISSHYESFGLVAVEALACGTPVIASAVGGLPSIVQNNSNGVLVSCRCPDSFARQFDAVLGDPARLKALHMAARPSILHLSWPAVTEAIVDLYNSLCEIEPYHLAASIGR